MANEDSGAYPFEASLERLEALVNRMESGNLTLEDSLSTFEEGIRLTRECQLALGRAEEKVRMLIERNGKLEDFAFDAPDDD
jgi:exodeoxyribonuclease VII small subunit